MTALRITKNQLLAGTSALALVAAASLIASPAFATSDEHWVSTGQTATDTQVQTATSTAGQNALLVNNVSFFLNQGGAVAATSTIAGSTVTVNSAASTDVDIVNTGDFSTIVVNGAGTVTGTGIAVTKGRINGANTTGATNGVIVIDGATNTTANGGGSLINVSANGQINNTGAGGTTINLGSTTNAAVDYTVTNAGTISDTNGAGSAIIVGSNAGSSLTVNNSGTLSATAAGGNAITVGALTKATINNSGAGAITGIINLGTNAASSINLSGTSTDTGAVTMGAAGQVLTLTGTSLITGAVTVGGGTVNLSGGTVTGAISGAGILNSTVNTVTNGTIGGVALTTINVTDSTTLDASTHNNAITATNINIGTSTAGGTLKMGTGALTGIVDSKAAGTGTLEIAGTNTLGAGTTIGAVNGLALIQIDDGFNLVNTTANGVVKATTIQLGSTSGGETQGQIFNAGTANVTGNITTLKTDYGVATFGGSGVGTTAATAQVQAGNIGASGAVLHTVNVNGNTSFAGDTIYATTTAVGGSGILNLGTGSITGAVTTASGAVINLTTGVITGAVDGTGAHLGTVNFAGTQTTAGAFGSSNGLLAANVNDGSNVTLGSTVAAFKVETTTVNTGGTLNFGSINHTAAGDITTAGTGTVNFGDHHLTLAAGDGTGNFTTTSGSTIGVKLLDAGTNLIGNSGELILSNGAASATINAGTKVSVDTSGVAGYIKNNTAYTYLSGTGANTTALTAQSQVTDNSVVLYFTDDGSLGTAGLRKLIAHRVAGGYNGLATTTDAANIGSTFDTIGATAANADIVAFLGRLDSSTSTASLTNALKEVQPQVNATGTQAIATTGQSLNVVGSRLQQLRAGIDTSNNGMAAGGAVADKGVWVQGFGSSATQDLRSGVDGYDVTTGGGAIGADTALNDATRVGLSFSYAKSTVDSNGTATQSTDIDSYQGNLYGSYNMGQWYTDGLLGFAYQDYNTDRTITSPSLIAKGSFSGETYTARTTGGYHIAAGNGIDITPNAGLTYYYNHVAGYTETGAGGLNLNVGSDDTQALLGRVGADIGHDFHEGTTLVRPVLHVGYSYDFIGDKSSTTSTFTGDTTGTVFTTKDASPARGIFDAGASLNIVRTDNLSFTADYTYEAKSGYDSNSGMLRARYNF